MFLDRTRYVLNLLINLALTKKNQYTTVEKIATEIGLPEAYLGKIVGDLAQLGYIATKKGPSRLN